mmetsp:Transcript_60087/g.166112  ORF Transcript_60087/g.166112 Transcript_60087/m.166112 type:complete len:107 (+) Transcript_60087:90-410(+)
MVKQIKDKPEFDQLIGGDKAVIVDFTASWCPPCKAIGPVFVAMAESGTYPNLEFIKVDVDEGSAIAEKAGISAMPTFQLYKGGQKVEEFCGADEGKLKELCEKYGK